MPNNSVMGLIASATECASLPLASAGISVFTSSFALVSEIEAWEVLAYIGNVKNNRPELMDRVGLL